MKMIFTQIYSKPVAEMILSGEKCQTRRLVKEGEEILGEKEIVTGTRTEEDFMAHMTNKVFEAFSFPVMLGKNKKVKWQVGRNYAVQLGRGKPGLWYCPKCKRIVKQEEIDGSNARPRFTRCGGTMEWELINKVRVSECGENLHPLRIKLTDIRKERLLEISKSDVKKEGFKTKKEFLKAFNKINVKRRAEAFTENIGGKLWNPDVWVISFLVKK